MVSKRKTAKDIAKETTMKMVKHISEKADDFIQGDETASLTADEAKFLQDVIKLEQEAEQGDAVVSYLSAMDDKQLDAYHERLRKSLEEDENLN